MRDVVIICIVTMLAISGCSHLKEGRLEEADRLYREGNYDASLKAYGQIVAKGQEKRDLALFEMGVIYAHAGNEHRDHEKALECFRKVVREFPASGYRHDSEMMISYLNNGLVKDNTIALQQARIEALQRDLGGKEDEIAALQKRVAELEHKLFALVLSKGSADRIVVEKKQRRLTLMSDGEVLKTYRIALGGDPEGPKERAGDRKTPEGTYTIDSRNKDSRFHLSLHISYPNERDKRRAKELGVAPGGDIMIHGLKNGLSWVGGRHTEVDWTEGCIAVTDEEIEEIYKLAPNGTIVEIRP